MLRKKHLFLGLAGILAGCTQSTAPYKTQKLEKKESIASENFVQRYQETRNKIDQARIDGAIDEEQYQKYNEILSGLEDELPSERTYFIEGLDNLVTHAYILKDSSKNLYELQEYSTSLEELKKQIEKLNEQIAGPKIIKNEKVT